MSYLTEFNPSILIGIGSGFFSGIFLGILDYSFAKLIQRNQQLNLVELIIKSIVVGTIFAVLLGVTVFIEINFSSSILSISQINTSTIILAIVLPLINFVVDKFLGLLTSK